MDFKKVCIIGVNLATPILVQKANLTRQL